MLRVAEVGVVWQASNFYRIALSKVRLIGTNDLALSYAQWTDLGTHYFSGQSGAQWVHTTPCTVRYLTWFPYENHGNGFTTEVDEVAFTATIPEPGTFGAILGLAAFTFVIHRSPRTKRVAECA